MSNTATLTIVILLFFLSIGHGQAQEYLWPTDASHFLTSAFCDARGRRFHAGIDVKTWGRVGYNVFAVRSGYVWRITVSPFGYGKALYVKLDTGETAVYAHLSEFAEKIQARVEAAQNRAGKYRVDFYLTPEELPVTRGELIAFTGQTGVGAPHLHFEIRDAKNRALNPLAKGYLLPDQVRPAITAVSFTPLDKNSEVNGDYRPLILVPQWVKPGEYAVYEPVTVWGKVGLAVSGYDQDSNSSNPFGLYSLKLFVDDVLRFHYQFDGLSFDDNTMVDLERDYRLARRNAGKFYKLYKDKHNSRSGYRPDYPGAGVLKSAAFVPTSRLHALASSDEMPEQADYPSGALFPGLHDFRIEVSDFTGNVSSVAGQFAVGSAFRIEPLIKEDERRRLHLQDILTFDVRKIEKVEAAFLADNRWQPFTLEFTDEYYLDSTAAESEARVSGVDDTSLPRAMFLKFIARDQFSTPSHPFFYIRPRALGTSGMPTVNVAYDYYDDYVRVEIGSQNLLGGVPEVTVYPGRRDSVRVPFFQRDLRLYVGRIAFDQLVGGVHPLRIAIKNLNGEQSWLTEQFSAIRVDPPRTTRLISDDQNFWINFWDGSLYQPLYGRIFKDSLASSNGRLVGNIYTAEPTDVVLKEGAMVYVRIPGNDYLPEKLGIYYKTSSDWVFIDNKHDAVHQTISAKVFSLETFALLVDEEPPEITAIRPGYDTRISSRTPLISVHVRDKQSGIGSETNIVLRLDERKLIAEYDPERERVFYQVTEPLQPGRHEITVWVQDRAKNESTKTSGFWIN
jgi:hypothetical protein